MFELRRNEAGSIAIISALVMTILVAVSGGAVDYARKRSAETLLRSKVDAALFAVAKARAADDELDVKAGFNTFFDATATDASNVQINSIDVNVETDEVIAARLEAEVPASLLNVIGIGSMQIEILSKASYSVGALELVLALDATDSMDDGIKFPALKSAANELVDDLHEDSENSGELLIGVVPFAQYVNVGLGNRDESWIDVPPDTSETNYTCTTTRPLISSTNCVTISSTCYRDGAPYSCTSNQCDYEYGPEEETCRDVTTTSTWRGCVGSRDYPLNTQDGSYGTPVPGVPNARCPSEILPLSKDKDAVKATLNGMATAGDTYIPAGLMWAWRMISKRQPFSQGSAKRKKIQKYIVLMTDGANTRAPTYPEHNSNDTELAKSLMSEICTNIKNDGVNIITIAFDVADTATQDALKSCSTDGYYEPSGVTELKQVFKDIRGNLVQLKLME